MKRRFYGEKCERRESKRKILLNLIQQHKYGLNNVSWSWIKSHQKFNIISLQTCIRTSKQTNNVKSSDPNDSVNNMQIERHSWTYLRYSLSFSIKIRGSLWQFWYNNMKGVPEFIWGLLSTCKHPDILNTDCKNNVNTNKKGYAWWVESFEL